MKRKKYYSSSPYDDGFKTLINGPKQIILPLLNEIFDQNYTGEEIIEYSNNEIIIPNKNNKNKVFADSSFYVLKDDIRTYYHIECQTNYDKSMLMRMYQYDSQIARLNSRLLDENTLLIDIPLSAVIYLRSDKNTPDEMFYGYKYKNQKIIKDVKVLKLKDYGINDIFEKELYFLLPFYIFNLEKLIRSEKDNETVINDLRIILNKLNDLINIKVDTYTYSFITEIMKMIVDSFTKDYNIINKEVFKMFGGKILDIPVRREYLKGINEGIKKGKIEGIFEIIDKMITAGDIDEATAKKYLQDLNNKNK